MEGKNKKIIEQEMPAASAWNNNSNVASPSNFNMSPSNVASPFAFMAPSNLPLAPSPFHVWQKPYFMNHASAGASSSGAKSRFFQGSDPISIKADNNNKTDQNPSGQNLTLQTSAAENSARPEVGNGGQNRRGGRKLDPNMDPRKLRRVISNRLSAQKSRIKKLEYVSGLEKKAESLETLISLLSPQVALQRDNKYLLQLEQKHLNQRIAACANHRLIVDAEIEERRAEVNRLRQLFLAQEQQRMLAQTSCAAWEQGQADQVVNPCLNQTMYVNPNQGRLNESVASSIFRRSQKCQTHGLDFGVAAGQNTAGINGLNQFDFKKQQREKPGQIVMPVWEPGRGQLTDVGLNQSGPGQVLQPSLNQSEKQQKGSSNSNLGGLEQILNMNPGNRNPRNDFL